MTASDGADAADTQPRLRLRQSGLEWRELDGEVVAMDLPEATYLATNRTGAKLWEALARGVTHDELVCGLVDEYELDRAQAERDVSAFLADLRGRGLLDPGE